MSAVIAAAIATAMLTATPARSNQSAPPEQIRPDQRIADLVRAWYFLRLFHPSLADRGPLWDDALIAAVEPALAAADREAFAAVVDAMLQKAGGSEVLKPASAMAATDRKRSPPLRLVDGVLVVDCLAMAESGGRILPDAEQQRAITARGMVLDCRHFAPENQPGPRYMQANLVRGWLHSFVPAMAGRSFAPGANRVRYHDGYPTEVGTTTGGYANGTLDEQLQPFPPGPAGQAKRVTFLFDETTPNPGRLAGGMQAAGLARVVNEGHTIGTDRIFFPLQLSPVALPISTYVYPDGRAGFRPDACSTNEDPIKLGIRFLAPAAKGPRCQEPTPPRSPTGATSSAGPADSAPPVGQRVLALAKLWGAIEYFYPYKELLDRPWYPQLDRFAGPFLAAETREAYELAIQRLAHQINDTHSFVGGLRASELARRAFAPPVYIRPVGDGFAVAAVHDATLDVVKVGDELVAVDGKPVSEIAAGLSELLSISTPQSFRGRIAPLLVAGPQGSDAVLGLRRNGTDLTITLKRAMPSYQSAAAPVSGLRPWRRIDPEIGYVDLSRLDFADADRAMDELLNTKAIVFDLRGYPNGTGWPLASRLAPDNDRRVAALFRRPTYRGPPMMDVMHTTFEQAVPWGNKPRYSGGVVVMIDDRAISQSEHTALLFKAARPDTVFVGAPTTGTNGDVTQIRLPGDLFVGFTGHSVRHPDGRELERVGILPDIAAAPTLEGMRTGRDEVFEVALSVARTAPKSR